MLYLASRSPRRIELLARLRVDFSVLELDVPELRAAGEGAADYVRRVAREKAEAGRAQLSGGAGWVLAADTEVMLDERVFGKPQDVADARAMLEALSGRTHTVLTALCLLGEGREWQAESLSQVRFDRLDEAQMARYLATGEWQGKAGGYAIQGEAESFIARLEGSHSGVMGLPLRETAQLLRRAGVLP